VTDRLRDYVDGNILHVPETVLPEAEHAFEIYIEDTARRATGLRMSVSVEGS
jgi:hypothetical protein